MILTLKWCRTCYLIKLADRLHNQWTWCVKTNKLKIASEPLYNLRPITIDLDCTTQNEARGFVDKIYWTCYLNDTTGKTKETKEEQDDYIKSILSAILKKSIDEGVEFIIKRSSEIDSFQSGEMLAQKTCALRRFTINSVLRIVYRANQHDEKIYCLENHLSLPIITDPVPADHADWSSSPKSTGYEAPH
jgi:GTP pyrophosphokinase